MESLSHVQRFYHGKNLFITGGTGFLGQLLVEKILRSSPGVGTLYLLVRKKVGKDIYSRKEDLFNTPVFDKLKQGNQDFRKKIVLIVGECSEPNLGISATDQKIITENVNIIFHLAATVKINDSLKNELDINVRATSDLLYLVKSMKNLEVFMHVSTAFSNIPFPYIEEKIYMVESNWKHLTLMTDDDIQRRLSRLIAPWTNTYTFTKAIAENEVFLYCKEAPMGIFRPGMVISTFEEPIRHWINNLYGPTGVVVATGKGLLRTILCDKNVTANTVPADYTVNCLIVAALDVYMTHKQRPGISEPVIYNYVSSVENRITLGEFTDKFMAALEDYPLSTPIWYHSPTLTKNSVINALYDVIFQLLPAMLVDGLLILMLRKPKMLKTYEKLKKFALICKFFTMDELAFCNKNVRKLWEKCSDFDRQLYPFSMAELSWEKYFKGYTLGIRRYLLKEKDESLPQMKRTLKRLFYLQCILKMVFLLGVVYILYSSYCLLI